MAKRVEELERKVNGKVNGLCRTKGRYRDNVLLLYWRICEQNLSCIPGSSFWIPHNIFWIFLKFASGQQWWGLVLYVRRLVYGIFRGFVVLGLVTDTRFSSISFLVDLHWSLAKVLSSPQDPQWKTSQWEEGDSRESNDNYYGDQSSRTRKNPSNNHSERNSKRSVGSCVHHERTVPVLGESSRKTNYKGKVKGVLTMIS